VLLVFVIVLLVVALFLLRRRRLDRAAKVFLRAGLQVSDDQIQRMRDEFAQITLNAERQKISEESKQQTEREAMQREKERILDTVRNTPAVVRETGKALQAIELEYQRGLKLAKSAQAREALRLIAEKKINDVLHSINGNYAQLPQFNLTEEPEPTIPEPPATSAPLISDQPESPTT
jgi:hypothetical protein